MVKYKWNKVNNYFFEIHGFENRLLENDKFVSEARVSITQDGLVAKLVWIYVPQSEQGNGYAIDMLKEIKNNILLNVEGLEKIVFDKVTSLKVIDLIKKVFTNAEVDFSYLPDFIKDERAKEFNTNPWIPELSPAKYEGNDGCSIPKYTPSINMVAKLNS